MGQRLADHQRHILTDNLLRMLLRENVLKIEIGPDHIKYFVHPCLLSHHLEYFKRALNGSWKEAEECTTKLDDVDYDTCGWVSQYCSCMDLQSPSFNLGAHLHEPPHEHFHYNFE